MEPKQELPRPAWYRTKWVVVTVSVIVGVIVLLGAIAGILYALWLASPERRMIEATTATLTQPATYYIESDDTALTVRHDGTRQALAGTYDGIQLEAVLDHDTMYVKSSEPEKLIEKFGMADQLPSQFGSVVAMVAPLVKDKWVSVGISKLSGGDGQSMNCVSALREALATDADAARQLAGVYASNRFIAITTESESTSSATYALRTQPDAVDGFLDTFTQTELYKPMAWQCDGPLQQIGVALRHKAVAHVSINTSPLRITALRTEATEGIQAVNITVQSGPVDNIAVPRGALSYDDLRSDMVRSLLNSLLSPR